MCDLRSWNFNILHKFVLMWLFGVILFELVLSSTYDVHRIVFKTDQRKNRNRNNYKYHLDHQKIRKPTVHQSNEDELPSETIKTVHQYYNHRPNHKNESYNGHKRGKFINYTTIKSPPPFINIADLVEFTTVYSEKLPISVIDSTFEKYYDYPSNNSFDLYTPIVSKRQKTKYTEKVRQLREKETSTSKNISKGYEVYEEIIGDISSPSPHSLLVYNVQNVPIVTTTFPTISQTDGESLIKENISDNSENNNKTYGKRTKSRRNRGNVKFE